MKVSVCTLMARFWDIQDIARRLGNQTCKDFEWVVVDFMQHIDGIVFQKIAERNNLNLIHVPNVQDNILYVRDIARNRNRAISYASGEYVIFLDDHTVIDPNFINDHLKLMEQGYISCGKMYYMQKEVEVVEQDSVSSVLRKADYTEDSRYELMKQTFPDKADTFHPVLGKEWTYTGNLGISMKQLQALNGFDPRLSSRGEDGDLGLRADASGYPIYYNPMAESVNLCTDAYPCVMFTDHEHALDNLLEHDVHYMENPETLVQIGMHYEPRHGCAVAVCDRCGAEFILNPAKLIYDKLNRREFVVDKTFFNLQLEQEKIRSAK